MPDAFVTPSGTSQLRYGLLCINLTLPLAMASTLTLLWLRIEVDTDVLRYTLLLLVSLGKHNRYLQVHPRDTFLYLYWKYLQNKTFKGHKLTYRKWFQKNIISFQPNCKLPERVPPNSLKNIPPGELQHKIIYLLEKHW